MKTSVLTQHPRNHATGRLIAEGCALGLNVEVVAPYECRVHWPLTEETKRFDLTLNRLSSIEDESFVKTLMNWPVWGRQVNAWEIRQKLWDKTRQALWMAEHDWPCLPFFTHRGPLTPNDPYWRAFAKRYAAPFGWVLKMNRGQRGVGVHFMKTENELFSWLETLWRMGDQDFFVQPCVPPGIEYRVTTLGQKVWAVLERKSVHGVANFAQGGEARELTLSEWPAELKSLVELITAHPVADVLSLDILISPAGPVISDINTVPGLEQLEAVTGRNFAHDLWKSLLKD
jgi:hypothetical protein